VAGVGDAPHDDVGRSRSSATTAARAAHAVAEEAERRLDQERVRAQDGTRDHRQAQGWHPEHRVGGELGSATCPSTRRRMGTPRPRSMVAVERDAVMAAVAARAVLAERSREVGAWNRR
jgi:hypothetical protein